MREELRRGERRAALALRMNGASYVLGSARTAPWSLRRSQSVDQRTEAVKDQLASSR